MRITFALPLALLIAGCPPEAPKPPPPPPQPASQPVAPPPTSTTTAQPTGAVDAGAGKRLFLTVCANCHGFDGTGAQMRMAMPKIGDLTSKEMHARMKDEDISALVISGRDKMPAFGTMFKPEQMQSLILYVRSLQKG